MSLAGFKKRFHKSSQYLSEKVGGNKGSDLDDDIIELGRKLDVINELVEGMQRKSKEYLQPNSSARTKVAVQKSLDKFCGQSMPVKYTQPEFNLGEILMKAGNGLSVDTSIYASALSELGLAFIELAKMKESMEETVKKNFLSPLNGMQKNDLKEISSFRKKLESRRLDYDYKRRQGSKGVTEEMQAAADKFEDSKESCFKSMSNFLENDAEHIQQLHAFAEAICKYHKKCADIMSLVTDNLSTKISDDTSQRSMCCLYILNNNGNSSEGTLSTAETTSVTASTITEASQKSYCRALYDFDAEDEDDLGFVAGDVIEISSRIDDNWLEGECNGKSGYFPESFVELAIPL